METNQVYYKITSEDELPDCVNVITGLEWNLGTPDLIVSFITGKESSYMWRSSQQKNTLREVINRLVNSGNILVLDNGLDWGTSALISAAIKEENSFSQEFEEGIQKAAASRIRLIGIVMGSQLKKQPRSNKSVMDDGEFGIHLDPNHSHFLIINVPQVNKALHLRVEFEKQLRAQLRRAAAKNSARYFPVTETVIFIQGGAPELDQLLEYVQQDVQILILEGSQGMADVLAKSIFQWRGSTDESFRDIISDNLDGGRFGRSSYSADERALIVDKIAEIIKISEDSGNITVIDINEPSLLANLDASILRTAMESSAHQAVPEPHVVEKYWLLAVKSNAISHANEYMLKKFPWVEMEVPRAALMEAILLPDREEFVDLFLRHIKIRHFLTHEDYLILFKDTENDSFFIDRIWKGTILKHDSYEPVTGHFIRHELNYLLHEISGLHEYIDLKELSLNALGMGTKDPTAQDSQVLKALIVYAVLFNRVKLIKILLKYSVDPVSQALFVALLFRSLSRYITTQDAIDTAVKNSADFDGLATELLDTAYVDYPERCVSAFKRKIPEFNNLTMLEIAYRAFGLKFLSHPVVQTYIEELAFGHIEYRGGQGYFKMVISALLAFPAYKWLTFPKLVPQKKPVFEYSEHDRDYGEPRNSQEVSSFVESVRRRKPAAIAPPPAKKPPAREYPPFPQMMLAIWSSPVVKYWVWLIIYHLFLILIGVDIMLPPCMYIGVDIAVFVCTALIWLDLVLRTLKNYLYGQDDNYKLRIFEMFYQTAFNILFFLYRIAPFRETQPFSGRVILAFGVIYYYYSVWDLFLYFPYLTAATTRAYSHSMKKDLIRWLIVMAPLVIATGVVYQAITTPDWPMTGDEWRHAFYRALGDLWFYGFTAELDYSYDFCEPASKIDWKNFLQPEVANPPDRCWLGDYTDYTCNTISVWNYIFVIHYFVLLKLAMSTVLTAYYLHTQMGQASMTPAFTRYERFNTILRYGQYSYLPWPLSILHYLGQILTYNRSKRTRMIKPSEAEKFTEWIDSEAFTFWRARAMIYFANKQNEEDGLNPQIDRTHANLMNMKLLVKQLQSNIGFLNSSISTRRGSS